MQFSMVSLNQKAEYLTYPTEVTVAEFSAGTRHTS